MFSKINLSHFLLGLLMIGLLIGIFFLPGDFLTDTPIPSLPVKTYTIQNSIVDTASENAVTAIYLDYRLFDTLFETMLLFVSVIAVFYFSRHQEAKK